MIDDEDKKLFRQAMKHVTPLGQKPKVSQRSSPKPTPNKPGLGVPLKKTPRALSDGFDHSINPHQVIDYFIDGIDTKLIRQIKKGAIRPTRQLDLHAMRREHAHHELDDFLANCYREQHRLVLIIHGKGQGILKNLIFNWLQQYPFVLGFHSATPRDGGTGALYVYLKRHS